ncbi:MAG: DNA repair protein RecN [Actinomycetota bacterium]
MDERPRVALDELHIRDVGVIADVTVELDDGLNVLTGETGAGKTMVVAALELLLGARADTDQVRAGAERALVEGRLSPPPPAAEGWVDPDETELVVSREVGGARSRARLGGRLAPASALAEVLGEVVEVHGQSDAQRLSAPGVQRELLDRSGGAPLAEAKAAYGEAYHRWRAADAELRELVEGERDRAREIDRLRFELDEIDAVAPEAGEEEALDAELARLEHAETLSEAARGAAAALTDDGGARDALGAAVATLRGRAGIDGELDALAERLDGLAAEVQDAGFELASYAEAVELDPARLEALRERRAALAGLCRKYGPDAEGVAAYAEEARARLAALEGGDARSAALAEEVDVLLGARDEAAERLRAARIEAGGRLAEAVGGHLADLAMADATMSVEVAATEPAVHGADRVTFLLAANAGSPPLPLAKAASGGERSRVALAVRLALADADATPVLVFDEVDAGVGGATALAVGEKLARLARGRQVLCVTHLAQLAAHADCHLVVDKRAEGERTEATVRRVGERERVTELSRMLSGDPDSAAAGTHAAELLASARATLAAPS